MRALVLGSDGQDGRYLTSYLDQCGYEVFGVIRKKAVSGDAEIQEGQPKNNQIYADLNDFTSLLAAIDEAKPQEVYNLAGQSEIPMSWKQPLLTAEVNALGVLRVLEAIRILDPGIRFFQASSSELFGCNNGTPCNEESPMKPRNPYGTAKLFAHHCVANYRENYGMFACSGILFNHESVRRPPNFVTRKITQAAAEAALGSKNVLRLGNLDAVRDWGAAEDYVRAMHLLLQHDKAQDVVIATGEPHTVRDFVTEAYASAGRQVEWSGHGLDETARFADSGETAVLVDPAFVRKPLLDRIIADPKKLYEEYGFQRHYSFQELVRSMVQHDIELIKTEKASCDSPCRRQWKE